MSFELRVREIIAETFAVDVSDVRRDTVAFDIPGWDSLGHSTLLMRLSRILNLEIGQDLAGRADDVGELVDMLAELDRSRT